MITFEQEKTAFYHEVGRALTQWASIEMVLFGVFTRCFKKPELATLYTAFIAIENFRSRLQMVDRAFEELHLGTKHHARWQEISGRLVAESKVRNRIAHWPTQPYEDARPGRRFGFVDRADVILPLYREKGALDLTGDLFPKWKPPKDGIYVREVMQCRARWRALGFDMLDVDLSIGKWATRQLPASLRQPEKQPQLQQLISQIRKELSAPP